MCRIAGIISTNTPTRELLEKVSIMCQTLAHGGPDDQGLYRSDEHGLVLGHRRLAIIDLSAKGHQPMPDATGKIWISFNGEIYNYPELKLELQGLGIIFNSDTDTEVLIQAYKYWGTGSFGKLRGMFAFALFDSEQALTHLVRDSSGIKPLYYHIDNGKLSFASEVRAFKDAGIVTDGDEDWPIRFLAFGHIPEPYTTLKNVRSLPKGHYLSWHHYDYRHQLTRYNIDRPEIAAINNIDTARRHLCQNLHQTVKRQMLADAPLGVFLSGGVDSSLLTLLADQYKKDQLKTVSIFFDEDAFNERHYQDIISERTDGQNFAHLVTQHDLEDALPQIIADMDMPTTDGINSWFISKYARLDGLKAVLSGLGADELFGGYPSFRRIKYLRYLKWIPSPALRAIANLSKGRLKRLTLLARKHPFADYLFLRGLFSPADIAAILNVSTKEIDEVLFGDPLDLGDLNDKERASWLETNLYMQNQLLRDTDVMSMAHGLEVRVPFLDEDLVHLVNNLSPDIRFDSEKPKRILAEACEGLLPREIWDRPKMGFSFPLQQWMRSHKQISNPDHYKGAFTQNIIKQFQHNPRIHWSKVYALYQLNNLSAIGDKYEQKKISLLSLQTFSGTGGIQKMTRTMAKAIGELATKRRWDLTLWSGYDKNDDVNTAYIKPGNFRGFGKNRALFAAKAIVAGSSADTVILTHINLALVGVLTKLLSGKTKIWLIAHGIEVWRPLSGIKRQLLKSCDRIICVSEFTRQQLIDRHGVDAAKCVVLNNALDPTIKLPADLKRSEYLMQRYRISPTDKVVFTLTRLASSEQYKGYEQVIHAVSLLKNSFPDIKYILSGKYDSIEAERIKQLIAQHHVEQKVILTGYIDETELVDHFTMADVFVLPSKKEGFGIVFIEAMACGTPVICGNEDGSVDAIRNGELGKAVNVDDVDELKNAIADILASPMDTKDRKKLQQKCLEHFNAAAYQNKLEELLINDR
ncbi:asparagine synthase (glutamine-hydrolyzing) [Mucilaginibacter myungsuensis]|uniref:asparagine synthase (glutamine-hydrolyzing) n=1 Tax=Mucilaginibacter myungsuensis TaxID=649104 RepID=A0A929KVT7_9SPHI|nr:asparagine synthase (glutamine-hydrolyzing) [Mucilaginibacter myungsuensis]MBE9660818.1 asparagine synthase (glutamine-hydrolyzing) [Mucilaginibacter myungsuensis]MDN3600864.1 asparagine synthase (glutamine-hydrolyzing) [Mucilaginibacter myungsuensis]